MPSGPKKRKKAAAAAAKKKEEEEMGISHPPNNTVPHQEGNEVEEKGEMESHSSDVSIEFVQPKEEAPPPPPPVVRERSTVILLDKVEASEADDVVVRDTCVPERPIEVLLERVSEEASAAPSAEEKVENSEAGAETSVVQRSTEIVLPNSPSEEESVEVTEVPVSVPADSAVSEGEEAVEMPNMGTVIECSIPAPTPLLEHRATIWNCCGLLDVFNSSQR